MIASLPPNGGHFNRLTAAPHNVQPRAANTALHMCKGARRPVPRQNVCRTFNSSAACWMTGRTHSVPHLRWGAHSLLGHADPPTCLSSADHCTRGRTHSIPHLRWGAHNLPGHADPPTFHSSAARWTTGRGTPHWRATSSARLSVLLPGTMRQVGTRPPTPAPTGAEQGVASCLRAGDAFQLQACSWLPALGPGVSRQLLGFASGTDWRQW